MKKLKYLLCLLLAIVTIVPFTACKRDENTIVVGASSTPHKIILEEARKDIEAEGFKLKIMVYNDYVTPNKSLDSGDIDANYFQHEPYLIEFNKKNKTDIVSAGKIHYELMAIYGNGIKSLSDVKKGTKVIVPSDGSNQTRALFLLAENGLITLDSQIDYSKIISIFDIKDKKGLDISAAEAGIIPSLLKNNKNSIAVINGNYALNAKIDLSSAIATENKNNETALNYANIIAVKRGNENSRKTQVLVNALKSERVKNFINENFKGIVVPSI